MGFRGTLVNPSGTIDCVSKHTARFAPIRAQQKVWTVNMVDKGTYFPPIWPWRESFWSVIIYRSAVLQLSYWMDFSVTNCSNRAVSWLWLLKLRCGDGHTLQFHTAWQHCQQNGGRGFVYVVYWTFIVKMKHWTLNCRTRVLQVYIQQRQVGSQQKWMYWYTVFTLFIFFFFKWVSVHSIRPIRRLICVLLCSGRNSWTDLQLQIKGQCGKL